jgi:DtxR family Mn-dependent transcriptional regulator
MTFGDIFSPGGLIVLLLVAAVAAAFWPRLGLLARLARLRKESERVRLEDALKHLHDYERAGRTGTLENLAGRLGITRGAASELLSRLDDRGLAEGSETGWRLTEAGRSYALRILRTHRLWERYLADRTGVPAGQWHAEAERVEHRLSEAEVEALASRLGDPRYDPHGDPIPTAAGDIPERLGTTVAALKVGESAVVRHLEDEPAEVFDRLLGMGLVPGQTLEVLGRKSEGMGSGRVRIQVRGEEHVLGAVDAANVTVERLPAGAAATGPSRTLAEAERGETVRATGISPACQGPQRRRLLDLGVVPGTAITPELVSAAGDPVAYRVRGALIALRREQASWIEIETEPVEAEPAPVERAG